MLLSVEWMHVSVSTVVALHRRAQTVLSNLIVVPCVLIVVMLVTKLGTVQYRGLNVLSVIRIPTYIKIVRVSWRSIKKVI
jgi:hypothetical protein